MDILFAGVGGQGVVLASEVTARVAAADGYDVKQGEVHGVAQRGGAVVSHLRYGTKVHSPVVKRGDADFLVAFEKLEALRYAHYLKADGLILVNDHEIQPILLNPNLSYPHQAIDFLRGKGFRVLALPATEKALALGNVRVTSVVMLGALSRFLDLSQESWQRVMQERVPPRLLEINQRAFVEGGRMIDER
jgi:indolepyruvate ferredoxin oxidoreductase beta subunit